MERTLKSFVIHVLVAVLVFSGTLVLANAHKEDVEQKSISLGPFWGFSVRTKEATSVSLLYAGILPLEETVKVQTVIDLTEAMKKFGWPSVIPMKPVWVEQYRKQYHILEVDQLAFFYGIGQYPIRKEVIWSKLVNSLPSGWGLYTSDRIGDISGELELAYSKYLEWRKIWEDLQEIAREIIEFRMKKLVEEALEEAKKKAEEFEEQVHPYPVIYERILQDIVMIKQELYPIKPIYPVKPTKPEKPRPVFPPEKPFSFDVFTIETDSKGNLKQYHIGTLKLTESWFYPMEQTEWWLQGLKGY